MDIQLLDRTHSDMIKNYFGDNIKDYRFIVADMENNDYGNENFKLYGEIESGEIKSFLVCSLGRNLTYFSFEDRDASPYKDIIDSLDFFKVTGPSHMIEKIMPYLDIESDSLSHMGVVHEVTAEKRYPHLDVALIENESHLEEHYHLLSSSEEYKNFIPDSKEQYIEEKMPYLNMGSRTMFLHAEDAMVSASATVAESSMSAIVVGVVTNPKYRKKGYGTEALIGLFTTLLSEGKSPYLFYNNPQARTVYKNMGMKEVCPWRNVYIKK